LLVFADHRVTVFAIIALGITSAVIEIRRFVDYDDLAVFQMKTRRLQMQLEIAIIRQICVLGTMSDLENDVACAYDGPCYIFKSAIIHIAEIVAGMQLFSYQFQYIKIICLYLLAHDHLLDALLIEDQFDGLVGDIFSPITEVIPFIPSKVDTLTVPETATQDIRFVPSRNAMQPRKNTEAERIGVLSHPYHVHVNGKDVFRSISVVLERNMGD